MPDPSPVPGDDPRRSALFTDLYELTMAQAYEAEGMRGEAVFELFFRELPRSRDFVVAAGLESVLDWLENLRFGAGDLEWLRGLERFDEGFLDRLAGLRFTGDVWAVPEGTVVFENEPIVQVVAPLPEAQLVETWVLNQVHYASIAATKAARVVLAARGRNVVDFGSRRAHGSDAALTAARSCWIAGAAGTSNVLAGKIHGVPVFGTMAHSYVQAHDSETEAFAAFAREFPDATLLVDTYDTLEGVRRVIGLRRELGADFAPRAVRLDSGDLAALSVDVRRMLDGAGMQDVKVFASSGLDEHEIDALLSGGAPIDGFGVGTRLVVSPEAPDLDMAYKLVAYDGRPRTKLSSHKVIHPGRKQVFRRVEGGRLAGDTVARFDERCPGEPLLRPVMRGGRRTDAGRVALTGTREHCRRELDRLPEALRGPAKAGEPYRAAISAGLRADLEALRRELGRRS